MIKSEINRAYGKLHVLQWDSISDAMQTTNNLLRSKGHNPLPASREAFYAHGRPDLVPASEKLMAKLEVHLPDINLKQWENVNDVVGTKLNIGAYCAGAPIQMINRKRRLSQQAPLAIFMDLSGSSMFNETQIASRGACFLALARILSSRRPVKLYVGAFLSANSNKEASLTMLEVDTSPVDLSKSALLMSTVSVLNDFTGNWRMYTDLTGGSGWCWGSAEKEHARGSDLLKEACGTDDVIYIGAAWSRDPNAQLMSSNPEAWLLDMIRKHGGLGEE